MSSVVIKASHRCFRVHKAEVIQFIQTLISRSDAVKHLNANYQEGSFKHWNDLLYALLLDQSDVALLTFDEAAFIGREMKLVERAMEDQGEVIETLPVNDFRPEKRRVGRPRKAA